MKYSKILLFMTALSCIALQAYAQNPDEGLTSMENWLNQPDNYFPGTAHGWFLLHPTI